MAAERGLALTEIEAQKVRDQTIRTRNRALFAVLGALAALVYAVTIVRIGG